MSRFGTALVVFAALVAGTFAQQMPFTYTFNGSTSSISTVFPIQPFLTGTLTLQNWAYVIEGAAPSTALLAATGAVTLSRATAFAVRSVITDTGSGIVQYNGSLSGALFFLVCNRTYDLEIYNAGVVTAPPLVRASNLSIISCNSSRMPLQLPITTTALKSDCNRRGVQFSNIPVLLTSRIIAAYLPSSALPWATLNLTVYTNNTYNTHGVVMFEYVFTVNRTVTALQNAESNATYAQPHGVNSLQFLSHQPDVLINNGAHAMLALNATTLASPPFESGSNLVSYTNEEGVNGTDVFRAVFASRQSCQSFISATGTFFRRIVPAGSITSAAQIHLSQFFLDCESNTLSSPPGPGADRHKIQARVVSEPGAPFIITDSLARVWSARLDTLRASVFSNRSQNSLLTVNLVVANQSFPLDDAYLGATGFNSSSWYVEANVSFASAPSDAYSLQPVSFTEIRGPNSGLSFAVGFGFSVFFRCNENNTISLFSNTTTPAFIGPYVIEVLCTRNTLSSICLAPVPKPGLVDSSGGGLPSGSVVAIVLPSVLAGIAVLAIASIWGAIKYSSGVNRVVRPRQATRPDL